MPRRNVPQTPPIVLPGGPSISWGEFLQFEPPEPFDPVASAVTMAVAASGMLSPGQILGPRREVNAFTIGAALLACFARQAELVTEAPSLDAKGPAGRNADALVFRAARIASPMLKDANASTPEGQSAIRAGLVSGICCQFSVQGRPSWDWARSRYVVGLAGPSLVSDELAAVTRAAECGFHQDLTTLATVAGNVVAKAASNAYLRMDAVEETFADNPALAAAFQSYFAAVSLDATEVRDWLEQCASDSLEGVVVAFWQQFPAVHIGAGCYLLGPPPLVMGELGLGLLSRLMRAARDEHGSPSTPVASLFGERFEHYVGTILHEIRDRHILVPEHEFRRGKDYRSCDHVVIDRARHPTALLIETKLRRLSVETFFGHDGTSWSEDLRTRLAGPIFQVLKYLFRLHQAMEAGRLAEDHREDSERVLQARTVVAAAIFPSLPFPLHGYDFRELIWQTVKELLNAAPEEMRRWYARFRKRRNFEWIILQVRDVEAFSAWSEPGLLGKTLLEFLRDVRITPSVCKDGLLGHFEDYLEEHGTTGEPSILGQLHREVWEEISMLTFGKSLPPEAS